MSSSESEMYLVISWRLYARVKANWFIRLCFQQRWLIAFCGGLKTGYACVRLWLHWTKPNMTTSWPRSPLRHLRDSGDNFKAFYKLSKCCRCTSATTLVSVRDTEGFRTALMALTERRTLWQRITPIPSPRQLVALHTYLHYFAPAFWWHIHNIRTTRVLHSSQGL